MAARSLWGPHGAEAVADAQAVSAMLRCSLVVPSKPNASILETSMLDYFAYTDRAVALQVAREKEFAPVREHKGPHSAEAARQALHSLHYSWVLSIGATVSHDPANPDDLLEVSPLLSYDGENLEVACREVDGGASANEQEDPHLASIAVERGRGDELKAYANFQLPFHIISPEEVEAGATAAVPDETTADGLDTRPFYLQEYPLRPEVSCSHAPRFLNNAGGEETGVPSIINHTEHVSGVGVSAI